MRAARLPTWPLTSPRRLAWTHWQSYTLANSFAGVLKTTIVVPGAFTGGTNHFAHSGRPADTAVVAEYEAGPYKGFAEDVMKGFASIVPPHADASAVADAIVKIVDMPFGKRPFRVHVDPTEDGAEVTNMVMDRVRAELLAVSALEICCGSDLKVEAINGSMGSGKLSGFLLPTQTLSVRVDRRSHPIPRADN